jgi:chromosome partitioning protein
LIEVNRELLLRRQLKPISNDFDVILIDTPPAMRAATVNALVVADTVIIPIDSSSFALLGMNQLLKTIAAISETHNPSLKILVLTTMFNKRQNLDKIIRQQVEDFFGPSLVLESIIHRYVGVAEATAMKKGVVENSLASSATFDFTKLFNELKQEMSHEQERQGAVESIHR